MNQFKLYPLLTGNLKLDGGAMFGVVPKVIWSKLYPCDEHNLCNWSMRCLLVDTGDRRILIDTGIGNKQSQKFFGHYYLNGEETLEGSLKAAGYTRKDITDVILTHLHFDHAGGAVSWNADKTAYELTFPEAIYWSSKQHWEWATDPNNREKASFFKENILPIQEQGTLRLVESGMELYPGISVRLFNGHTEGQVIPYIETNGRTIVYMGDLLPSSAHIPLPFVMAYDTRPLITIEEKELFFEEAIEKDYILFLEHDINHECCTVEMTEKGVRVKEVFPLAAKISS